MPFEDDPEQEEEIWMHMTAQDFQEMNEAEESDDDSDDDGSDDDSDDESDN